MPSLKHHLARYSRDRQFLIRAFFGILAAAFIVSAVVKQFRPKQPGLAKSLKALSEKFSSEFGFEQVTPPERAPLRRLLGGEAKSPEGLAAFLRRLDVFRRDLHQLVDTELAAKTGSDDLQQVGQVAVSFSEALDTAEERELFGLFVDALYHDEEGLAHEAVVQLRELATAQPPPRFANEFYGNWLRTRAEDAKALDFFAAEVAGHPSADFARYEQLRILVRLGDGGPLRTLMEDPAYDGLVDSHFRTRIGLVTGSWPLYLRGVFGSYYGSVSIFVTFLALATGLFWFVIIAKLGGVSRLRETRFLLCLSGIALGALSTFATALAQEWQNHALNLERTGDFVNDLVFWVSGVGLREELIKFVFILPLAPILVRRRSFAEMLLVSGCVGLGFAVTENINYFNHVAYSTPATIIARLLTANFLHIGWTAILGLAFFRMCRWPKTRWEEFVGTFLGVVVVHGVYDALLSITIPQFESASILAIIIIALVAYRFFHLAAETREPVPQAISPLGVFVLGGALLTGIAWNYAVWLYGFDKEGLKLFAQTLLGIGIIGFVYLNQLREE